MSDYSEDLGPILDKLQPLLENLPNQLPLKPNTGPDASHYASLICFKPDDELVDLTGSKAGALNVHFEHDMLQGPLVMDMISEEAMVQVDVSSCRNGCRQPQSHHR